MSIESTSIEFEAAYAEYCAAERERLLREHGGKQLVAWWRRDQQWSVLFELGFGGLMETAELCDERVFGEPPGDGLWLWSGAFEYRQQGHEDNECDDVALGEMGDMVSYAPDKTSRPSLCGLPKPVALGKWRRLTEPELDRVRNGAPPWQRPWPPDEMRLKVWTKAELEREYPLGHGFEWMLTAAAGWSAFRLRKGCTPDQLVLESDGRLSGDAAAMPAVVVLQFLRALVPTRGAS